MAAALVPLDAKASLCLPFTVVFFPFVKEGEVVPKEGGAEVVPKRIDLKLPASAAEMSSVRSRRTQKKKRKNKIRWASGIS